MPRSHKSTSTPAPIAARPRFMTEPEVAELLRVSRETVRHWRWEGRIRAIKVGGKQSRPLYETAEVERFIAGGAS